MEMTAAQKTYFTKKLTEWHDTENLRSLPWKEEKDPYKIWLSEIILQQTRAQQGLPYYLRFTEAFPDITSMAAAKDEDAFRLWQGLGYYNRCKNMLATARYITNELKGIFPASHEALLELKGIGPYTAAAIASFAFNLPHAVVDGNVYRVLSRYAGIDTPFDSTKGKKVFRELADELLDKKNSAAYNQAIMDLGATVCTPLSPSCDSCPLQKNCVAYKQGLTALLPVRSKRQAVRKRHFHYLLLQADGKVWIHKRDGKDIWQNLHEPFLIEHDTPLDAEELVRHPFFQQLKISAVPEYAGKGTQRLTHQLIESRFFIVDLKNIPQTLLNKGKWLPRKELKNIAFPKTLVSFLEKKLYF